VRPIRLKGLASRIAYRLRWELAYAWLREPKTREVMKLDEKAIARSLEQSPVPVQSLTINNSDYHDWMGKADYANYQPDYYPENLPEKSLEHYLAARLLDLKPGDVYIDVASQNGAAAEIYSRVYGVTSYQQDLDFRKGMNGRKIGGDAASMPVPDAFADAMALHCSFEHFEGNSDIRFIQEVERVLKPGGRCVIVPLYLSHQHSCLTNPAQSVLNRVRFDAGSLVHASLSWHNRHGRFYSAEVFTQRLWKVRGTLNIVVHSISNFQEVDPSCYARFVAVITKHE